MLDIYGWACKCVLAEYKLLVTKMAMHTPKELTTKNNHFILLVWQNMLTLPCLISMLHYVNSIIKLSLSGRCYIVEFIFAIKSSAGDLY